MIRKGYVGFTDREEIFQIGDMFYASEAGLESMFEDDYAYVIEDAEKLYYETMTLMTELKLYSRKCMTLGGRLVTREDRNEEVKRLAVEHKVFKPVVKEDWHSSKKIAIYIIAIINNNNNFNRALLDYCIWLKNETPDDFIDTLKATGQSKDWLNEN